MAFDSKKIKVRDNEIDKFLKFSNISNINENKKYKLSSLIKLLETTTGKKVILENKNDDKYVFEIKKVMKKVGLKLQDINKDENYPNSYLCEYISTGIFNIKTFINMQKLLGCNITFKPKNNNITYIWFNF